jgi:hypothetical protein
MMSTQAVGLPLLLPGRADCGSCVHPDNPPALHDVARAGGSMRPAQTLESGQ